MSAHLKSCLQAIHVRWHTKDGLDLQNMFILQIQICFSLIPLAYYIFISSRFRKLLGAFQSSLQRVTNAVFLGNLLNGILKTGLSKFLFL